MVVERVGWFVVCVLVDEQERRAMLEELEWLTIYLRLKELPH